MPFPGGNFTSMSEGMMRSRQDRNGKDADEIGNRLLKALLSTGTWLVGVCVSVRVCS